MFGAEVALISVLAGLFAADNERGKVFGFLGLTVGLGSIIGGLSVGPLVDHWGYSTMFSALCLFSLALPAAALFVKDKKIEQVPNQSAPEYIEKPSFGKTFFVLLSAQGIALAANGTGNMGRSLAMSNAGFTATAITSTAVIAGLISLPLPYILGLLSDRLGRKRLMIICYVTLALSIVMFAVSKYLWHFWIAATLFRIGYGSISVGSAFITDLVEPKALGRGVSLFQSMCFIGPAIGLATAGYAFQNLGIVNTLFISAVLPAVGIFLLVNIRASK